MADTIEMIICPACGKEMKKVYISETGFHVDICLDGCGGMFFDNRELKKFDTPDDDIETIKNTIKDKVFAQVDKDVERICPTCNIPMVKMGSASGVESDTCNVCGAVFLDNEELTKLRKLAEYNPSDKLVEECLTQVEEYIKEFIYKL